MATEIYIGAERLAGKEVKGYFGLTGWSTRRVLKEVLNEAADEVEVLLDHVVETWNHKPQFYRTPIKITSNDASIIISTDDKPFFWLNEGTAKRYAPLSSDWQSKTQPRVMSSRMGRGFVLPKRGNLFLWSIPKPGIEAREWTVVIGDIIDDFIADRMYDAWVDEMERVARRKARRISGRGSWW